MSIEFCVVIERLIELVSSFANGRGEIHKGNILPGGQLLKLLHHCQRLPANFFHPGSLGRIDTFSTGHKGDSQPGPGGSDTLIEPRHFSCHQGKTLPAKLFVWRNEW